MKHAYMLALLGCLVYLPANAEQCQVTVRTSDQLQFDQTDIHLPLKCTQVALTLVHTGTLSADVMGHNWVLTRRDDSADVALEGIQAGREHDYVPLNDQRVIAHTHLIGGGQKTRIQFSTRGLKPNQPYTYFCSFPGHTSMMKGQLTFDSPHLGGA